MTPCCLSLRLFAEINALCRESSQESALEASLGEAGAGSEGQPTGEERLLVEEFISIFLLFSYFSDFQSSDSDSDFQSSDSDSILWSNCISLLLWWMDPLIRSGNSIRISWRLGNRLLRFGAFIQDIMLMKFASIQNDRWSFLNR